MILTFSVQNQIITRTDDNEVVSDSVGYLSATFTFSDEWVAPITAIFTSGEDSYSVILEENACNVPHEVINKYGFTVSCFCGSRITANTAPVNVIQSGYKDGQTPEDPTQTVYEQLLEITKPPYIGVNGNWYEWDAETKAFVDSGVYSIGDTGATPTISIGTVTDVGKDGIPYVNIDLSSTTENVILNIGLKTGETGATPQISIGTVTNVAPGEDPYVTKDPLSTAENVILNIGLVQGQQGIQGEQGIQGIQGIQGEPGDLTINDVRLIRDYSPAYKPTVIGALTAGISNAATLAGGFKAQVSKIEAWGSHYQTNYNPDPLNYSPLNHVQTNSAINSYRADGHETSFSLPYALRGILNRYNYSTGVYDYRDKLIIDNVNEVYQHIKYVHDLTLDPAIMASNTFASAGSGQYDNADYVAYTLRINYSGGPAKVSSSVSMWCTHLKQKINVLSIETTSSGMSSTGAEIYIRLPKIIGAYNVSTLTGLNTWLSALVTAETPMIIRYAVNTPVTTDITDGTVLSQFKNIYSGFESSDIVFNNVGELDFYEPPSQLEVTYTKDINVEIAELKAAILELA